LPRRLPYLLKDVAGYDWTREAEPFDDMWPPSVATVLNERLKYGLTVRAPEPGRGWQSGVEQLTHKPAQIEVLKPQTASISGRSQGPGHGHSTGRDPGLGPQFEATEVLPSVFRGYRRSQRLNILDLGAAEPESMAYYQGYNVRVCIADIVGELSSGHPPNLDCVPERAKHLLFDVCLLWDSLSHLDNATMAQFARDITARLHEASRIHAIAAYSPNRPLAAYRYAIDLQDRIIIKPRSRNVPHPRSQTEIERLFPGLRIRHTVLRRGNRLELMLAR